MYTFVLTKKSLKHVRSYSRSIQATFAGRGKKFRKKKREENQSKWDFGVYSLCIMRDIAPTLKDKALRSGGASIEVDLKRAADQHDELSEALLSTGCGEHVISYPSFTITHLFVIMI